MGTIRLLMDNGHGPLIHRILFSNAFEEEPAYLLLPVVPPFYPNLKNKRNQMSPATGNMTRTIRRFLGIGLAAAFMIPFGCSTPTASKAIFFGGDILTMAPTHSGPTEAVLVENGKIVKTGSKSAIVTHRTPDTRMIDLKGRTLAPGFIAAHTHPDISAYMGTFVDLSGFTNRTPEQVWNRLAGAVSGARPGEPIFCKGFDPMLVPGLKAPHISRLDAMAPDNPVVIMAQSLHSAWFNTSAFEALGITAETPDPGPASYYEKNETGQLTGFVAETAALKPVSKLVLDAIDMKANVVEGLRSYAKNGFTSIVTAGLYSANPRLLMLYEHLSTDHPTLTQRTLSFFGLLPPRERTVRHFLYIKRDTPHLLPESIDNGDDFFKIIGVKLWYDGSPYTGSMYLKAPYLDSALMRDGLNLPAGSAGGAVNDRSVFIEAARRAHRQGWQLAVHAQGDRAVEEVLDIYETILDETPRPDHRHRIEHGILFPKASLARAKRLGVTVSYHINHLYYYGEALMDDIIGPQRAENMLPAETTRKTGIVFSFHADQPMYPEDPISLMATAVTRKTRNGRTIGGQEAIRPMAAMKSMTIDAAWQIGMEDKLGSIEPGKYADFVILNQNPMVVPPERIRDIAVMGTYVHGETVWLNP
jgi:predicted amidohydrolase YtcJ